MKPDKKTIFYFSFYLFLIVDLMVLLPVQVVKTIGLGRETGRLKKDVIQFEEDKKAELRFNQQKEQLAGEILSLEGKIITAQDVSALSAYVSDKAKEYSVEIVEIAAKKAAPAKGRRSSSAQSKGSGETYSRLPLTIDGEAGFHNCAQFLNVLEKGDYFLECKQLIIREGFPYHSVRLVLDTILKE